MPLMTKTFIAISRVTFSIRLAPSPRWTVTENMTVPRRRNVSLKFLIALRFSGLCVDTKLIDFEQHLRSVALDPTTISAARKTEQISALFESVDPL